MASDTLARGLGDCFLQVVVVALVNRFVDPLVDLTRAFSTLSAQRSSTTATTAELPVAGTPRHRSRASSPGGACSTCQSRHRSRRRSPWRPATAGRTARRPARQHRRWWRHGRRALAVLVHLDVAFGVATHHDGRDHLVLTGILPGFERLEVVLCGAGIGVSTRPPLRNYRLPLFPSVGDPAYRNRDGRSIPNQAPRRCAEGRSRGRAGRSSHQVSTLALPPGRTSHLRAADNGDWRASLAIHERQWPELWAKRQPVRVPHRRSPSNWCSRSPRTYSHSARVSNPYNW